MYSIKAISQLTGIKPETLRTWERRFDFLTPQRDSNGRRLYTDKDAKKLSLISSLLVSGHSISQLAEQGIEKLEDLKQKNYRDNPSSDRENLREQILKQLQQKNTDGFRNLLTRAISSIHPGEITPQILSPVCHAIGSLWRDGTFSVSDEHAFTSILREELFSIIRILQLLSQKPKIAFTTPSGELHEMGLLLGCYLAAGEGLQCDYLGPNLPPEDLVAYLNNDAPSVIVMSIVASTCPQEVHQQIRHLSEKLTPKTELWVGISSNLLKQFPTLPTRAQFFEAYEPYQARLKQLKQLRSISIPA